jgi:hypothetical protein
MPRFLCLVTCALFSLPTPRTTAADPPEPNVLVRMTWSGSVADEGLLKDAPNCIVSDKGLDKVWKDWKINEKKPHIDFKRFIIVVTTSPGSSLSLDSGVLDKQGNLELRAMATVDIAPGFRYALGLVSKDGIKTVGGKKLPRA